MKRYQLLGIGLILFSFVLSEAAESAVPQALNYRGRLVDAGGAPVADGDQFVMFTLWDSSMAGTELWNSGIRIIAITDGLFSYNLGSNVPLPASLFLNNASLYLGITIGTDAEISPRTALTSSAFAYQSLHADSAQFAVDTDLLDGKDATQFTTDIELSAHQSDQSSHHRKTTSALEITEGVFSLARLPVGTSSSQIALGDHAHLASGGSTFIHWGSQTAPSGSSLLYSGFGYASLHAQSRNMPPIIIKTGDPGSHQNISGALFYPLHTAEAGTYPPGVTANTYLSGSVCFSDKPTFVLWGSRTPLSGWTALYSGYAMGPHYTHAGSYGPLCIDTVDFDASATSTPSSAFLYSIRVQLGASGDESLQGKYVRCVVCQKE